MKLKFKLVQIIVACMYLSIVSAQRLYIGVWRAGTDAYALYAGVDWNTFVAKWQQLASQNLRLIDVASYIENGVRLYTGVWRGGTDAYALYAGVDWNTFVAKCQQLASQNLRLINISSYPENGIRKYIGVWRGNGCLRIMEWHRLGKHNFKMGRKCCQQFTIN